ncbi:hypothetical protein C0995_006548 [Termitomyces sp. Mi166|nr:hypothetical protein C0995_006548 [Termitomyces sp. Mi166\
MALPGSWVSEFLVRSRTVPLDVHCQNASLTVSDRKALRQTLSELQRIRNLSLPPLFSNSLDESSFINSILSQPAPLLEEFVAREMYNASDNLLISGNLFGSCAPKLRKLELQDCKIPVKFPMFASLTTFKLKYPLSAHDLDSRLPSLEFLVRTLDSLPLLQNLVLRNAYYHSLTTHDFDLVARLPNLRDLEVDDHFDWYEPLLVRLNYPATTRQKFAILDVHRGGNEEALRGILPILTRVGRLIAKRMPPGRCLELREVSMTTHVAVWERAGIVSHPPLEPPNRNGNLLALCAIWSALPLTRLESLHVLDQIAERTVWMYFGKQKLLKNIRIVQPEFITEVCFLEALRRGIPDKDFGLLTHAMYDKPTRLLFQSFENLILDGWLSHKVAFTHSTTAWLGACLRGRRKRRLALRHLSFLDVDVAWDTYFERELDSIIPVVQRVQWVEDSPHNEDLADHTGLTREEGTTESQEDDGSNDSDEGRRSLGL